VRQTAIFGPFFATMLLTLVVWLYMYVRRIRFLTSSKITPEEMAVPGALARVSPPEVSNPSDNLKNLFEIPVLFYALVLYLFVTQQVDATYVTAAWVFVVFRVLHSAIHCTINIVLVRFYLYAHVSGPWPTERLDKIDFLLARLSEEVDDRSGELVLRDHHRLTEIFQGIWAQLGEAPPGDQLIEESRSAIDRLRHEMGGVESLDALNESALIRRYRETKHGLGRYYFYPELLLPIQETNLVFKSRIQKLYRQEEQRIVAEYQRVFELEREVSLDSQQLIDLILGHLRIMHQERRQDDERDGRRDHELDQGEATLCPDHGRFHEQVGRPMVICCEMTRR